MPVTAKLSKLFYERLGEQITNELVDWFNQVDATYRGDLKELNELNFARFDAKVEQRMTALEAKLEQRITSFEAKVEQRFTTLEAKLEQRFTTLETGLNARIDSKLDSAVAQHAFAQLDAKIDRGLAELRTDIEKNRTALEKGFKEQSRWLILAWSALLIPIMGLWMRG